MWDYQGSPCHLDEAQQQVLQEHVTQTAYSRVKDVAAWVEAEWGVRYSEDGIREMLHNLGFSYQKQRIIPGKGNGEAQALFFEGDF